MQIKHFRPVPYLPDWLREMGWKNKRDLHSLMYLFLYMMIILPRFLDKL